jgi:hypothetical protein
MLRADMIRIAGCGRIARAHAQAGIDQGKG